MRRLILASILTVTALGCGDSAGEAKKTPMKLEEVSPEVMKAAKEKLPNVTFTDAYREKNGDIELRGKDKTGKVYEVDVSPDGKTAKIE
ncbi:MAG: hypothetical protein K8U57_03690 [Planctomycetes bacterium]|nr:hypothetical protein [Planctomycetota bacterium]